MKRFKTVVQLSELPENGITVTEIVERLCLKRETVRSLLDRRKIKPIGYIVAKIAKSYVYDKNDVAFVFEYEFKATKVAIKCSIDTERNVFLSTPISEGVSWNPYK